MSEKRKLSNEIKGLIKMILIENDWKIRSSSHVSLVKFFKNELEIYTRDDLRIDTKMSLELKNTEFDSNEIENIMKLSENAKFDADMIEFIENFRNKKKWKTTSLKMTIFKKILINLDIYNVQDIRDIQKKDKNLDIFRKTQLSDIQVDLILNLLNTFDKKYSKIDPNDFDFIKNKIKNKELTSEDYLYLFVAYDLKPYNDYLKGLALTYLKKQI